MLELRLRALPPLLSGNFDAFDGVPRVGVPFEQTRYIPREFRDVLTLDEFLRITDEWDAAEARRCKLIEKRMKTGSRTSEEEKEFKQLQRLLMLHRRLYQRRCQRQRSKQLANDSRRKVHGQWRERQLPIRLSIEAARAKARSDGVSEIWTLPQLASR
ncbi:MAG: hypothetical protein IPK15_18705 [Verrucomicrobia bacterium]|nr:hypothetical protein [Verrucomicrobiota bacterium]